jgi:NAD+ diphosphatase
MRNFQADDFARFHPGGALGRRLSRVDDLMRPLADCRQASDTLTVREVIVACSKPGRRTGAIMLIDAAGRLTGLFTDSDLARLFERRDEAALDRPIREVMVPKPTTVPSGTRVADAVTLLADSDAVQEALGSCDTLVLGSVNGVTYLTCEVSADVELPADWRAIDLRTLYGLVPEQDWQIAGYAAQVLHWERTSRFCSICGQPTEPMQLEWMRHCAHCDHDRYPQVSPTVLVLVHDGADRILLAHKPGWGDRYSILAEFVLPGESLEECVHREVEEEVGVHLTDLQYFGSQPWPFPHQLMIGFTARYESGDIRLDEQELDHAAWFDVNALPPLPPPLSLSRQMIDAWTLSRRTA